MRTIRDHRGFWILAVIAALAHTVLMIVPPLNSDEAFIWNWARHLDLGYYSHPPMSAWSIALVTAILPTNAFTVRLAALLFHLGTLGIVYVSTWEMTRRKDIALFASVLFAAMPVSVLLGTMVSSDQGLIFFWAATVLLVKKALVDRRPRLWYAAGATAGGMMLSKFFSILFYPGLLIFLLGHPAYRRELIRKEPWLGVLVALVVFSPFLYWNATHRWLTFQFNLVNRQGATGFGIEKPFHYIAGQMFAASPVVLVLLVVALVAVVAAQLARLRQRNHSRFFRPEGDDPASRAKDALLFYTIIVATPLAVFALVSLSAKVGAHWAAVVYPHAAAVLTAWFFGVEGKAMPDEPPRPGQGWMSRLRRPKSALVAWAGVVLTSLPIIVVVLYPKVLPDRLIYYDEAREYQPPVAQYYGWHEVGVRIAELRQAHADLPGGLFLSTRDYSDASLFDFYTPGGADFVLMGYREQEFHGKEFLYWARKIKRKGANTLFVLDRPIWPDNLQRIEPYFKEVRPLDGLEIRDGDGRLIRKFWFALGLDYQANEPDVLSRW